MEGGAVLQKKRERLRSIEQVLPSEVCLKIVLFLDDVRDVCALSASSSYFHGLVNTSTVWKSVCARMFDVRELPSPLPAGCKEASEHQRFLQMLDQEEREAGEQSEGSPPSPAQKGAKKRKKENSKGFFKSFFSRSKEDTEEEEEEKKEKEAEQDNKANELEISSPSSSWQDEAQRWKSLLLRLLRQETRWSGKCTQYPTHHAYPMYLWIDRSQTIHHSQGLVVGNRYQSYEERVSRGNPNFHEWTVYVAGMEGSDPSHLVERVTFRLHPTFQPNVIKVRRPPFQMTRIGWGTFEIGVKIHFKKEAGMRDKVLKVKHMLVFQPGGFHKTYPIEGGEVVLREGEKVLRTMRTFGRMHWSYFTPGNDVDIENSITAFAGQMTYHQGCRATIETNDVSRQRQQLPLILTETQYIIKGRGGVGLPTPYSTTLVGNNCMLGVYDPSPYDELSIGLSTFYVVMREVSRQPPLLLLKLVYPLLYDGAMGLRLASRNPRYYQKKQKKMKNQKNEKGKTEPKATEEDKQNPSNEQMEMEEEEGIILEWRGWTTMAAKIRPFSLTLTKLIPNNSKNENDLDQQTLRNALSTIPPIMQFPYVFGVEVEDSEVLAYVEAEAERKDGVSKLWGFLRKRGKDRVAQETNEEIRKRNQQQKQRQTQEPLLKEDHLEEEELRTWMLVLVAPKEEEDEGGDRLLVAEVRGNQLFGVWSEMDCFALHLTTTTSDNS
ncbi:YEATS domain-containing protein 4-like [Balamuthia mandrillaris]